MKFVGLNAVPVSVQFLVFASESCLLLETSTSFMLKEPRPSGGIIELGISWSISGHPTVSLDMAQPDQNESACGLRTFIDLC